jgi:glycosyltransferase involved in cell wall biosynthesis
VPIVATRLPAHEEVAGEAAFWVDAGAVDALVERALTLADGSEDAVVRVEAGRARAATFSAERAAEQLQRTLRA